MELKMEYITIQSYVLNPDYLRINMESRVWCKLPYPDHPNGCPNYGKRLICPPQAPLFEDVIVPPFKLVAVRFDLEKWVNDMKEKHPNWSDRQARCCLYWQGMVRKHLREACEKIVVDTEEILYVPEAMGVNVFQTCAEVGIKLERNPRKFVWKIAIIGRKKI
jgi:predicted metal-binding protein